MGQGILTLNLLAINYSKLAWMGYSVYKADMQVNHAYTFTANTLCEIRPLRTFGFGKRAIQVL